MPKVTVEEEGIVDAIEAFIGNNWFQFLAFLKEEDFTEVKEDEFYKLMEKLHE